LSLLPSCDWSKLAWILVVVVLSYISTSLSRLHYMKASNFLE